MDDATKAARRWVVLLGVAFEGGLILVALLTGWMLGQPALATFSWNLNDALLGVAATVPPLLVFLACLRWPIGPLRRIKQFCAEVLRPALAPCSVAELALISLLAGLGEEMLFRGVLQRACAAWSGDRWVGLAAASVLFGLAHAITLTYIVYAALMGAFLGWLWLATGNLLTVVVVHTLYDFAALLYLLYGMGPSASPMEQREGEAPAEPGAPGSAGASPSLPGTSEGREANPAQ
jgi:membrane protease YdiL (CAAX protease family)